MKALFLSRLFREKVLLVAFAALIAGVWLWSWKDRAARFWAAQRHTTVELRDQALWLSNHQQIEDEARKAVEHLDPSRTFDAARLVGEIAVIASGAGLKDTAGEAPRTEQTAGFAVNSVEFSIRKADLASLLRFYDELGKRAPYITIEQLSLAADRANPALLNASLRVVSVEIAR